MDSFPSSALKAASSECFTSQIDLMSSSGDHLHMRCFSPNTVRHGTAPPGTLLPGFTIKWMNKDADSLLPPCPRASAVPAPPPRNYGAAYGHHGEPGSQ